MMTTNNAAFPATALTVRITGMDIATTFLFDAHEHGCSDRLGVVVIMTRKTAMHFEKVFRDLREASPALRDLVVPDLCVESEHAPFTLMELPTRVTMMRAFVIEDHDVVSLNFSDIDAEGSTHYQSVKSDAPVVDQGPRVSLSSERFIQWADALALAAKS